MKMRRPQTRPIALLAAACLYGFGLAGPADAFRPRLPPAGDCEAMIAATGGKGVWVGEFSGRYEDPFGDDRYYPLAARGCFRTEAACRRWTNEILSIAGGSSALMSCRPYNRRR